MYQHRQHVVLTIDDGHVVLELRRVHLHTPAGKQIQRVIGTLGYSNARFLYYINEIRSAVLVMHGEKAHSRYFGEAAYHYMVEGKAEGYNVVGKPNPVPENKQLLIIPDATHCDLYDGGYTELVGGGAPKNLIPWDSLAEFFHKNLNHRETLQQ